MILLKCVRRCSVIGEPQKDLSRARMLLAGKFDRWALQVDGEEKAEYQEWLYIDRWGIQDDPILAFT